MRKFKKHKDAEELRAVKNLVKTYGSSKSADSPSYDNLPMNSGWLNKAKKLGSMFKGSKFNPKTGKGKLQVNYKIEF